jgi:cell wall-associated NlpC family hydrolase
MEYGICNLALIPLRGRAEHVSELVSQVLFGETFEIMEYAGNWVRIITTIDGYEGWIHSLQFTPLAKHTYDNLNATTPILTTAVITAARKSNDHSALLLPFGCSLPYFTENRCNCGDDDYSIEANDGLKGLLPVAYSFLNSPYLWGGRTHFGVDCSGFTQAVLRTQGVNLLRDARLQAEQGQSVHFLQEAQTGDLAFFDNAEGRITHVGIMLANNMIIHASGRVKIDKIDDEGIYADDLKRYTHKLRIIKRFELNS